MVDPVAETQRMKRPPHGELRSGVASAVRAHSDSGSFRRGGRDPATRQSGLLDRVCRVPRRVSTTVDATGPATPREVSSQPFAAANTFERSEPDLAQGLQLTPKSN
jgi:hypothetical protein